jgi:hypothetical protein
MADESNASVRVSESDFAGMLDRLPAAARPQLVFLAACRSAARNPADRHAG